MKLISALIVATLFGVAWMRCDSQPDVEFVDVQTVQPAEYRGEVLASWYGKGRCLDGSAFTGSGFTCASRDYPRGTWLILRHDGKTACVRVNDYGPDIEERGMDVSRRVAEHLGFKSAGLAWLQVWEVAD